MNNCTSVAIPSQSVKAELVSDSWLEAFSRLRRPDQKLELMDALMESILDLPQSFLLNTPTTFEALSHKKKLLYSKKMGENSFFVEWMHFSGDSYTGLHTHPELICDHILSGSLIEQEYDFVDGLFFAGLKEIRTSGDRRLIDDLNGLPHNVSAQGGPCETICISYGQPLRMIPDCEIGG